MLDLCPGSRRPLHDIKQGRQECPLSSNFTRTWLRHLSLLKKWASTPMPCPQYCSAARLTCVEEQSPGVTHCENG